MAYAHLPQSTIGSTCHKMATLHEFFVNTDMATEEQNHGHTWRRFDNIMPPAPILAAEA